MNYKIPAVNFKIPAVDCKIPAVHCGDPVEDSKMGLEGPNKRFSKAEIVRFQMDIDCVYKFRREHRRKLRTRFCT